MIYIDSSVLLAYLFAEDRCPRDTLWAEDLGSSRLLAYEVWTSINGRGLAASHAERAGALLERVNLTDMTQPALARAAEPFPIAIRTLDALHLATMDFLQRNGESVQLASYDRRLVGAARALGIPLASL